MLEDSTREGRRRQFRALVPHALTGARVVLGAGAVITAHGGQFHTAATLITLGAVTDGFDGFLARRLNVSSSFGALFDTFTDYLCFIVAPWALARALVVPDANPTNDVLLGLPLLTGAIRSARNSLLIVGQKQREVRELPGLATVFFAFLPVAAVFLGAPPLLDARSLSTVLIVSILIFSLLMVTSIPYPKLSKFGGLSAPIFLLLAVMPFYGTRILAGVMVVVGLAYVLLAHRLVRRPPHFD